MAAALSASIDSYGMAADDEADARGDLLGPGGQLGRLGQARRRAGLEAALRLAQLVLERGDAVLDGVDRLGADGVRDALERLRALAR